MRFPGSKTLIAPWWETTRRNGEVVPDWIQANLRFYNRVTKHARVGFYTVEVLALVVAAAVPAAAALGASVAVTGVLGAGVTALIGLRQLSGWRDSWVRYAQTRLALEREVVAWSAGVGAYSDSAATPTLLLRAGELIAVETDRWAALRLQEKSQRQQAGLPAEAEGMDRQPLD